MPGKILSSSTAAKRKRSVKEEKPVKRARSESSDDEEEDPQGRMLLLVAGIFESKKNYNNISILTKELTEGGQDALIAAHFLGKVFARLGASGELDKKKGASEKDLIVVQWLRERFSEYKSGLLSMLPIEGAGSDALKLAMEALIVESKHVHGGNEYSFPIVFLTKIVEALLDEHVEGVLRKEYSETWVEEYDDIRYYTFDAVEYVVPPALNNIEADRSPGKSLRPAQPHLSFSRMSLRFLQLSNPYLKTRKNWRTSMHLDRNERRTPCIL